MYHIFQKIPFLRILIATAAGIVIARFATIPSTLIFVAFAFSLGFLFYFYKNYQFRNTFIFGSLVQIVFCLIGTAIYTNYNKPPHLENADYFAATVLEAPLKKEKTYKSLLQIISAKQKDSIIKTNEKVLVYFEPSKAAKKLQPGNTIIFNSQPKPVENYGNPFEFDYKKYLNDRKIYRQLYLKTDEWQVQSNYSVQTVHVLAEQTREKLLAIYRGQPIDPNELEILSALTLGYKREIDPETKRVFAAAGAMHVLAVSGLHVGILFWVLLICCGFMQKQRYGKILFVLFSVCVLWGFAFVSGMSPSVERAATMFSLFVIGKNLNRQINIYNTLAATAFLMLLFNPNNLFNVGFQLSFSAVFGIVYLQPKFSKIYTPKNKISKFLWLLFTVSISAQIATFPIVLYYFNQFPVYFWLSNMIVIPSVMVLIPLGLALLLFAKIPVLSSVLSFLINYLIKIIYLLLSFIEQLPFSVQNSCINSTQLALIVGILLSMFLFFESPKANYLKTSLYLTLALCTSVLFIQINRQTQNRIIVYNNKNLTTHLIRGKTNYIVTGSAINDSSKINYAISNTCKKLGIDTPIFLQPQNYIDKNIFIKNGLLFFGGKTILFDNKQNNTPDFFTPDFILPELLSREQDKTQSKPNKNTDYRTNKSEQTTNKNRNSLKNKRKVFYTEWKVSH